MQINAAIKKLRESLGESQQSFATRLGISIRGLANYETSRVPSVVVLAKLQELAKLQKNLPDTVIQAIDRAFLDELPRGIGATPGVASFAASRDSGAGGLMFEILNSTEEYAYAVTFQHALRKLRQDHGATRKALVRFFDAVTPFMDEHAADLLRSYISGGHK